MLYSHWVVGKILAFGLCVLGEEVKHPGSRNLEQPLRMEGGKRLTTSTDHLATVAGPRHAACFS